MGAAILVSWGPPSWTGSRGAAILVSWGPPSWTGSDVKNAKVGPILLIATWNATGIMSSASYASDLLMKENVHILGLSDHWLYQHNLHSL